MSIGKFVGSIAAITIVWLTVAVATHLSPFFTSLEQRGQFGDSFGSINALFAGFAFAGVVYAILLQREELKLQREELSLTRKELVRAANAQESSSRSQVEQLDRQTQAAKLAALTALLDWELSEKAKRQIPTLASPTTSSFLGKEGETVEEIRAILRSLG